MSAFVVSHDHIDALLTFASDKRIIDDLGYFVNRGATKLTPSEIGRVLLAENERSVCHRYPDCTPGDAPGKIGEEAVNYNFHRFSEFDRMQHAQKCAWVLKACQCFDYQACETDDYEQSIAHQIIRRIEARVIESLPYYEEAPWGIDRARVKVK
jgi:hypothetical protein